MGKFYLGASLAGHQVDGGQHDQWTAWEKAHATELASMARTRWSHLPIWKDIKSEATNPDNYLSGEGVCHKEHYQQDFKLLKQMGLDSLRFSIEWAELEPTPGQWNQEAIDYYHAYFKELKSQGIEPFVTLWHWTHPMWFEDMGGMANRKALHHFERFALFVVEEYGQYFKYLIVQNEPNVYTSASYLVGEWPPQVRSARKARRVYLNLMYLQRRIYGLLKDIKPDLHIGLAILLNNAQPKRASAWLDLLGARIETKRWNWWFLDKTSNSYDFIGVNYYFTDYIKNLRKDNPAEPQNDMGWYMEPSGLENVLVTTYQRYRKPLIVTETGTADRQDQWREWWIRETLTAVSSARNQGANVFGYLHWSLLDNFEWSHGWWPKFGLIQVDRRKNNMPRSIRNSSKAIKKP